MHVNEKLNYNDSIPSRPQKSSQEIGSFFYSIIRCRLSGIVGDFQLIVLVFFESLVLFEEKL